MGKKNFEVNQQVRCVPVIPGFEDIAYEVGTVMRVLGGGIYEVLFPIGIVRISDYELESV